MDATVKYSLCGMCNTRCLIEVHCKDGQPQWVCGNRHTLSGSALCPRGAAAIALYNDTTRPSGPLIRVGKRGEGKWRSVSWDEALDYVADSLKGIISKYGGRSVFLSERPGTFSDITKAFMQAIGSPNHYNHDTSCAHNVNQAAFTLTGYGRGKVLYDYKNCTHIVVQGRNFFEALSTGGLRVAQDAIRAGCQLTCIDVRPTVTGVHSDENICIRPATDYAFNLAIINTLIRKKLYNAEYVDKYVQDFAALSEFTKDCTPEWAAKECDIDAKVIEQLAEDIAAAAPHVIWHGGWMTARYEQSFMTSRSAFIINALLGSYGSEGGLIFRYGPKDVGKKGLNSLTTLYPKVKEKRADGVGWSTPPFASGSSLLQNAFKAVAKGEPYPLKAYIAMKHDPLTSMPDPETQKKILENLELLVSVTFSWSDTAWHSDVVLPMHMFLEQDSLIVSQNALKPRFLLQRAVATVKNDTKSDWWIYGQIAKRLGLEKLCFESIEKLWEYQLEGTGYTIEDFAEKGFVLLRDELKYPEKPNFGTESGKIEIISSVWEKAGVPSLIPYRHIPRLEKNNFRLIIGRDARHTQAHTQNNPLLHHILPTNVAWIATERADALQIKDGDTIHITAANGHAGTIKVRVVEGIHPDALFMLHGFGHRLPMENIAKDIGLGDQEFMDKGLEKVDEVTCGIALQEHFVTISKCTDYANTACDSVKVG